MASRPCVLIVDDEAFVRDSLAEVLSADGYSCLTATSIGAASGLLASETVNVVVTDLSMPDGDGLQLLREIRKQGSTVPVLMMTGVGTVRDAVAAIQSGAYDFLQKPIDFDQLALVLRRAIEHHELVTEVRVLRDKLSSEASIGGLVGSSAAMDVIRRQIDQVAPTDVTVLVQGESGTGKELVAEQIHSKSPRSSRRLVRVNCAAIPSTLFESEFFGHKRGSFSGAISDRVGRFAEAQDGTLVLDEIGSLPLEMQAKLLRVLENGEYQVVGESRTRSAEARVIALTNEKLSERVQRGEFRADLYYRFNVFPITMPPLRTHKEDVSAIAQALLAQIGARHADTAIPALALTQDAEDALLSYDWPGNVRELRNVLERAVILAEGRPLDGELVRSILESSFSLPSSSSPGDLNLRRNLDSTERSLLLHAIERAGGRKKDAAAMLGIDPRNLGYYLRKHGLGEVPSR
jgi:DNA-binding NtrC family response regulator